MTVIGIWGYSDLQAADLDNNQCLKCHSGTMLTAMRPEALAAMVRIPDGESPVLRTADEIHALGIDPEAFDRSVHAGLRCVDCHPGIERLPHPQHLATIGCVACHDDVGQAIAGSAHDPASDGKARRPQCTDCHGSAHTVLAIQEPRSYDQTVAATNACIACHHNGDEAKDYAQSYRENIHGQALFDKGLAVAATCYDCHGAHRVLAPDHAESMVHPQRIPQTCGTCHQGIETVFLQSIHGVQLTEGNPNAATCSSCHHSHGIKAVDQQFLVGVVQECSTCHLELGATYLASYHGKATSLGGSNAAVCSSCHGAHDIQPQSDPRSHVAPANLEQTCAKCHDNVNANFVKYIPHANIRDRQANPEVFYTWLVMTVLLLSVLAVFIPHGMLWFQRSFVDRLRNPRGYHAAAPGERWVLRFRPIHRFTHFLVVVSFMGLVATGFPLKYSETGWAKTMAELLGGSHMMGLMHRGFALLTFAYAGIHAGFLIWFFYKHCPRPRWRYIIGPDSLIFSLKDLKDFFGMVRWFLWLGPRPKFERWAYFEKFDYWGEIWGIFVIGGTGMILWFPTLFTRWLPGWVLNCAMVVHSIEALLAASVIFLVHFFNTHLRPEKFPIDMVMLTGRMTETEMKEEREAEYDRLVETGQLEGRIVPPIDFKLRLLGAVIGIIAFLFGMFLIVLAIRTELSHVIG